MPLVFACIAPHGSMAIPEAKPPDRPTLAAATTAGMLELGRRFAAARPEVSIVLTPHNVHVEGAMAVIDAAAVAGDLAQWGTPLALKVPVDRELAPKTYLIERPTGREVAGGKRQHGDHKQNRNEQAESTNQECGHYPVSGKG